MRIQALRTGVLTAAALVVAACSTGPNVFRQTPGPTTFQQFGTNRLPAQVVELRWQNRNQIVQAATSGIDLFGAVPSQRKARARVTAQEMQLLQSIGMNVQPVMEARMDERGGLPTGYMTYGQMVENLKGMAQQFPQLVTLEDIGDTHLKKTGKAPNNDIWAITISNKQTGAQKPTLMLTAGVHARELAPVELVMKLANDLTSKYGKDPEITQLLDTRAVVLLPMVNVDGRIEVEKGNSWQRKNLNGSGIDLNRNFDSCWNYKCMNAPSSWLRGLTSPSSETYSGPSAASEVETQAVQSMYTRKKIHMAMDIHAYGEMFFWPLGYSEKTIPEAPQYRNVYQNTFARHGYSGGTSLELLYPTSGTTDDYGYEKHGAFSMGLEVGSSFRPNYPEVEAMWNETRSSWLNLMKASGQVQIVPPAARR
ncbi:MAG: M14 family zinc carboxypeptidase [Candidatus Sericytochromatia bacterium]